MKNEEISDEGEIFDEEECITNFEEYFAECDWQRQQEIIRRLDKLSKSLMFEHENDENK